MPTHVYANNNEIASKASEGKSIAAFPDVCFSPPAPPVGPMPLPYPNTGECTNTDKGTSKVFIKDKMSGMEGDSNFSKSMGDESATKNFTKGMITSALQGKCYFGLWSMDVQMEGKGVPRHLDMVTHNHGSMPSNTVQNPTMITVQIGMDGDIKQVKLSKCCYKIEIVDIYGKKITASNFICKGWSIASISTRKSPGKLESELENISTFSCTVVAHDREDPYYADEIVDVHDASEMIIIYPTENITGMSVFCYDMFKFSKDNGKYTIFENEKILLPNSPLPLLHKPNKKAVFDECKLYETKIQYIPMPSFPVVRFGAWDQSTAYNLAIMSEVAYSNLYENTEGMYKGSLHNIACNLSMSNTVTTDSGFNMIVNSSFSKSNAIKNIDSYKYIYIKSGEAPNAFGGKTHYSILGNAKQIIVAFRGTAAKIDWFIDFAVNMKEYKKEGLVHVGFSMSYDAIEKCVRDDLKEIYVDQEIFVTGHSLGGAIALIFADCFKCDNIGSKLVLYTYGMPRVFDLFSVMQLPDFCHYRHVYESDIVPRCVPTKLPPRVISRKIFDQALKNALFKVQNNERSHCGYLYYIERKNKSWVEKIFMGISPSERSKSTAEDVGFNYENDIYFFPQNNINMVNTKRENITQNFMTPTVAPIINSVNAHLIENYIRSLKNKLVGSVHVVSEEAIITQNEYE